MIIIIIITVFVIVIDIDIIIVIVIVIVIVISTAHNIFCFHAVSVESYKSFNPRKSFQLYVN